jgi:hypothetical protein
MAYRPQSNGTVERVNRTLISLLRSIVNVRKSTWDRYLQQAVFAYNTTPHRATGVSPFLLVHGEEARLPVELIIGSPPEARPITDFMRGLVKHMTIASESARAASNRAQRLAKRYYDANIHSRLYKTGDVVYVQIGQIALGAPKKLADKWDGPCVVQSVRNVQVELLDPKGKLRRVHVNRLSAPVPQTDKRPASSKRGRGRAGAQSSKKKAEDTERSSSTSSSSDDGGDEDENDQYEVRIEPHEEDEIGFVPPDELPDSDDDVEVDRDEDSERETETDSEGPGSDGEGGSDGESIKSEATSRKSKKDRSLRSDRPNDDAERSRTRVKSEPESEVAETSHSDASDHDDTETERNDETDTDREDGKDDDTDTDRDDDRDDDGNDDRDETEMDRDEEGEDEVDTGSGTDGEMGQSDAEDSSNRPRDGFVPSADAVARSPAQKEREPEPADAAGRDEALAHPSTPQHAPRVNDADMTAAPARRGRGRPLGSVKVPSQSTAD